MRHLERFISLGYSWIEEGGGEGKGREMEV